MSRPVAFQPQSAKAITGEVDDGSPEVDLERLGASKVVKATEETDEGVVGDVLCGVSITRD